jgi:hypothetical protein
MAQALFTRMWSSGFLPTKFSGVALRAVGDPVLVHPEPAGRLATEPPRDARRAGADERDHSFEKFGDPEIQTRIAQYEMAFRMQTSVPELVDLSKEARPRSTCMAPRCRSRAASPPAPSWRVVSSSAAHAWCRSCIAAGTSTAICQATSACNAGHRPAHRRALLDLKQRGLLHSTLVIWGGEFGRTVYSQGTLTADNYGRDHHPRCFPCGWPAAASKAAPATARPTTSATTSSPTPSTSERHQRHDPQPVGIDHERLSFKFQGSTCEC